MSGISLTRCPGTLAVGFDSYSQACLNRVFGGRKVSPVLPYASFKDSRYQEEVFEEVQEEFVEEIHKLEPIERGK